jgi:hypothetical protein
MASRRRHAGSGAEWPVQMPKARAPLTRGRLRTAWSPPCCAAPAVLSAALVILAQIRAGLLLQASLESAGRLGGVQHPVRSNETRSIPDFCDAPGLKAWVCMYVVSNRRRGASLVHEEVSISPMRQWYWAHISEAVVEAATDSPIVYNEVIVRSK